MAVSVTVEGGGSDLDCFSEAYLEPPAIAVYNPDFLGVFLVLIIPHYTGYPCYAPRLSILRNKII